MTEFYGDESPVEAKKFCPGCGRVLPATEFYRDQRRGAKLRSQCKHCLALQEVARREENRKSRPVATRERERQKKARYLAAHREQYNAYHRAWRLAKKRKAFERMSGITNQTKKGKSL